MKIEYLEKLGFKEEKLDVNNLKTSRGQVEFFHDPNDHFGRSSKIITPDLRYYCDGGVFGLHISDFINLDFNKIITGLIIYENLNLVECLVILYISRTNLINFIPSFKNGNLKYLNLSHNEYLNFVNLDGLVHLLELNITNCPSLSKVEINGDVKKITKVELCNCNLASFRFEKIDNIEYLNIRNNQFVDINISQLSNLKYFFGEGNPELNIIWPKKWIHDKLEFLGLNESNELISKDILEIANSSSDNELRENLKAYLKFEQKHANELVPINRHQIIILGNTTAGKTELKHRLLKKKRKNHDSTHGVQYFLEKVGDIEVMGYDFGGQDYYHALHLPFFNTKSHYIIVWGNHTDLHWGNLDSDNYYGKKEIIILKTENEQVEVENLLYPLQYWLKSIQKHSSLKGWHINTTKAEMQERYNYLGLINQAKQDSRPIDIDEIENIVFKGRREYEPIVDIVQNVRKGTKELFLDVKTLKASTSVRVQDILSFDFSEAKVGNWLRNKIQNGLQIQKNQIVKSIKEFGEKFYSDSIVLINHENLVKRIRESSIQDPDSNIEVVINSLINNHYIILPKNDYHHLKPYYIVNIQKFSEYIYQVLNKELSASEKNQGYFTRKEALKRITGSLIEEKEFVIEFLQATEVIFEVENSDKDDPKYVAPNYLPKPNEKVEKLFIESFEKADCEFEFHDFFHPNIILSVVNYYLKKGLLVKDDEKIEYLIWKNCVVIYNRDKNSKHYLKLELLLPNKEHPDRKPSFTISRSNAGFIKNDQFSVVFNEIRNILGQFTSKTIIKTPYGNYIPLEEIQKDISEGFGKQSQFIYSDGVLYPKYDFRHFLGDDFKAPLKLFIAYSKYDDTYRLELKDHLFPGVASGQFIVFDDREMDMGEKWHARLKKELEECDVFILLISVKTLGTPYVMNTEIPAALERMRNGNLKIIPILVSPCDWTRTDLSELNVYDKANPIGSQNENFDLSKDLGINERAYKWKEIVKQIENIKPNGFNSPNSTSPSDEPVSGNDKENDREQ